jgi:hypothetical protein
MGLADLRKILDVRPSPAKLLRSDGDLPTKVVATSNLQVWLTNGYFDGSVSWVTVLAAYFPHYLSGLRSAKTTQVSVC